MNIVNELHNLLPTDAFFSHNDLYDLSDGKTNTLPCGINNSRLFIATDFNATVSQRVMIYAMKINV
jgi:hypothetical protein